MKNAYGVTSTTNSKVLKMLPLGLIYAVGELLTLRSVQKAGLHCSSLSECTTVNFGILGRWTYIEDPKQCKTSNLAQNENDITFWWHVFLKQIMTFMASKQMFPLQSLGEIFSLKNLAWIRKHSCCMLDLWVKRDRISKETRFLHRALGQSMSWLPTWS